ncbi:hypothetical protein EMCRGX_G024832 [Ephydatia muelleri]
MFERVPLHKASSHRDVRSLVYSKKYNVFFNLGDGAADEDRAGEDVVRALEEFNVPFTGADLKHYDILKPDMKMIAYYNDIKTPKFFVFHRHDPPTCKCCSFEDLARELTTFVKNHNCAMVEEFIVGDEVTVLTVATPKGTKVLPPVRVNFPPGEDFKHFDLK